MVFTVFVGVAAALVTVACVAIGLNRLAPLAVARWLRQALRRLAGLQAKAIDVQGLPLPYLVGGTGEPLVLVHGFTADKDTWGAVARHLTAKYTVIAPDLPGFGDAARDPHASYSLDVQVENLRAFLHSMGLARVHLGGNSMGGGVVALYAAKYPHEVASLWLIDAAATGEVTRSDLMKHYDATGEFPLLVQTQDQQLAKLAFVFGRRQYIPHSLAYAMAAEAKRDFDFHRQILKTIRDDIPIEARYSALQTPTLIVTGDQDRVVPPASVHTLAKVFVNSQVKVMPGLGHIPMVEAPKAVAKDYLAFRAGLAP
jgi:triacylglycerol lipase